MVHLLFYKSVIQAVSGFHVSQKSIKMSSNTKSACTQKRDVEIYAHRKNVYTLICTGTHGDPQVNW